MLTFPLFTLLLASSALAWRVPNRHIWVIKTEIIANCSNSVPGADAVVYEPRAIKVDWQDDELTITQMDSTLTARQISRDSTPRGDMLSMELTASIRNEDRHGWSYTAAACCGEFTAKIHVGLSLGTLQTVHSATWLERRCHTDWEIYADCRGMQEAGYCDIREAKVEIIRNILT